MAQIIAALILISAWVTHIVVCICSKSWIMLVIGAALFPTGMIHGLMVWVGAA